MFRGSLAVLEGSGLRPKGSLALRARGEFQASPSKGVLIFGFWIMDFEL